MTGTWRLVRLAVRRDRVLLPVWLLVIVGLLAGTTAAMVGLYATEADRLRYVAVAANTAIARAFDGPIAGTSLGAITMAEVYGMLAILVGIMSVQAVTRHTRQEEETGRAELVGSGIVGRMAPLTAALIVTGGANLLLGVAVTLTFLLFGLPAVGAIAAGAAIAGVGLTFAAVAGVTAQVASTQRAANGLAIAVIGVAFLLRAFGDAFGRVAESGVMVISAWPSWLSPIGWGQQVRAFGDERWAVLALFAGTAAVLVAVAFLLRSRRDVGAGLVAVRPGPATASAHLRSPLGLVWRLQRWVLLGWLVGLAVISAAFGALGEQAEELIAISDEFAALLAQMGEGAVTDLFFAFTLGLLAVVAAGFTVQSLLRARTEESSGRVEPVLATAVSRTRWLLSYVTLAAVGSAVILLATGLAAGLANALATGEAAAVGPLVAAALVGLPAVLALGGFVVAVLGALPRWTAPLGWGALVASLVIGQFGELLSLPAVVRNLSPFTHTPALPAEQMAWAPVGFLLGAAVLLTTLGLAAFRRRDLAT